MYWHLKMQVSVIVPLAMGFFASMLFCDSLGAATKLDEIILAWILAWRFHGLGINWGITLMKYSSLMLYKRWWAWEKRLLHTSSQKIRRESI